MVVLQCLVLGFGCTLSTVTSLRCNRWESQRGGGGHGALLQGFIITQREFSLGRLAQVTQVHLQIWSGSWTYDVGFYLFLLILTLPSPSPSASPSPSSLWALENLRIALFSSAAHTFNRINILWLLIIFYSVTADVVRRRIYQTSTRLSAFHALFQLISQRYLFHFYKWSAKAHRGYFAKTLYQMNSEFKLSGFDFKACILYFCFTCLCWMTGNNNSKSWEPVGTRTEIFFK